MDLDVDGAGMAWFDGGWGFVMDAWDFIMFFYFGICSKSSLTQSFKKFI